ncbi:MAG: LEA type 2 family protein [Trueperaceae bacterium]
MKHFLLLLGLVSLSLLSGCVPAQDDRAVGTNIELAEPVTPVEPLTFGIEEAVIERFNPPGPSSAALLELRLKTRAQNINPFALTLTRIEYTLFLQNKEITGGVFSPNLEVAGNAQNSFTLAIDTTLEDRGLIKAAAQTYTGTPLPFHIEGTLSFTSNSYGFTTRNLTLFSGTLTSKQKLKLPSFTLSESRVFTLRDNVPVVRALVQAENTGDVGYFFYGKDLELFLDGVAIAKQDVSAIPLQTRGQNSIEILFYPSPTDLDGGAIDLLNQVLQGKEASLEIRGPAFIDVLGVDTYELTDWSITGTATR